MASLCTTMGKVHLATEKLLIAKVRRSGEGKERTDGYP